MQKLLFFLLFFAGQLSAQYADSVFIHVEQMPYFPGCSDFPIGSEERRICSDQAVKTFISNHITYPQKAKDAGAEGIVYASFIVDQTGQVKNIHLLNDVGAGCGQEAVRVLKSMPQWEPGIYQGEKVKVRMNLPIHFYFRDDKVDLAYGYTLVWGDLKNYRVSRKELRRNLSRSPMLFDPEGKEILLNELIFTYKRNNKINKESSTGNMTDRMKNFIRKLKKGGLFSIVAVLQKEGNFIEVNKEFMVVK